MKAHPLSALSALALCLCSGPALGQSLARETVALSDLDLLTGAGQAAAKQRIRAAAVRLCAQPRTPLLPRADAIAWRCRKAALARAEAELALPARSYAARSD
jgi:UrcA family protein